MDRGERDGDESWCPTSAEAAPDGRPRWSRDLPFTVTPEAYRMNERSTLTPTFLP